MMILGPALKLRDDQGVCFGVIYVPVSVADELSKRNTVRVFKRSKTGVMFPFDAISDSILEMARTEFFLIYRAYKDQADVTLAYITPEEANAEPGFAFLPSAEYMRRPLPEPKGEVRHPIDSGHHLCAAREVAG